FGRLSQHDSRTEAPQKVIQKITSARFVFHHENPNTTQGLVWLAGLLVPHLSWLPTFRARSSDGRQLDREGRTLADATALGPNRPTVQLDQVLRDREPD